MKATLSAGSAPLRSRSANASRIRGSSVALVFAGILFVLYPALRPFSDEASLQGAAAFGSMEWLVSHVMAILGFILLSFGLLGLHLLLQHTAVERLTFRALFLGWLGTGLTLPFYGAEVFGLYALGQEALHRQNAELIALAGDIRFGSGFIMIVIGLLLLAVSTIMAAIAIWRSKLLGKWSGMPLALGLLLYLPQYVGTQPIRVVHGLLITVGCLWIAAGLWKRCGESGE